MPNLYSRQSRSAHKGFTLIELLVVIAIISLLSSVVLASLNTARAKGRDAARRSSLTQVRAALELYYNDNGRYPSTAGVTWAEAGCAGSAVGWTVQSGGYTGPTAYIPGLAPMYIATLPTDPAVSPSLARCFAYTSTTNGDGYILWAHNGAESTWSSSDSMMRLIAPACTVYQQTFQVYGGTVGRCN